MMPALQTQAKALRDWLCDAALPFWAQTAIDYRGGWYEDLALDGTPNADNIRRLRVQARQIYVYALADKMGWYPSKNIVQNTFDFMIKNGFEVDDKPGFIHLLTPECTVHDDRRDFYDHAFYLLGCGWAYHVTGDPAPMEIGQKIAGFIDSALASPDGGWSEGLPEQLPRRQNPHMHFLEAAMAWHDITGDPRWMDYAKQVYNLFTQHFFDTHSHVIREFFNEDWNLARGELGQTAEPGHAAEWIWLLSLYEKRTGVDTSHYASALYTRLLSAGHEFQNDEETADGTPRRTTKRLWVQTELIKAHLAQASRGDNNAVEWAVTTIEALMATYLRPDGTWIDQIDAAGQPIAKTIPTSSFYHIICMIYETCEAANINSMSS